MNLKKIIEYLLTQRRWIGMFLCLAGVSLILLHYINYDYTLHFPVAGLVIDHGVVGVLLVIIGAILGVGKPGAKGLK